MKSTVLSAQGKEAVIALQGAGDFFGEGCLTGQTLRLSTAIAITKCVLVRITKTDITRVIHEEPAFAELFIAHLLARNVRVEEDLVDQLFNSSEKRLARIPLLLAKFGQGEKAQPIIANISQETLAEMIGTTRSRVSVAISNSRLIAADATGVTFSYKDYRIGGPGRYKTMTLKPDEFIGRLLMHVLPNGFHRIRHSDLLASGTKTKTIARARQLIATVAPVQAAHQPQPPDSAPATDQATHRALIAAVA